MRQYFVLAGLMLMIILSIMTVSPSSSYIAAAQTNPIADCNQWLTDYVPVTGTDSHPTPDNMPLPPVREAWLDPTFGTCLVRVTDRLNDFDTPQNGMKNEYSRVQAFNADETLIMVRSVDSDWFLYDASTLQPIQMLQVGLEMDEVRWDAQVPYRFTFSPWWDNEATSVYAG